MDKLLTVTIPSYNVENFLPKLMAKLLLIDRIELMEILIVNDGSKDNTLNIAKAYERKYPEVVHVIDKENGGHGSTINAGILNATGYFFKLVDADDWLDADAVNEILNFLEENKNIDLILSPFEEFDDKKHTFKIVDPFNKTKLRDNQTLSYGEDIDFIPPMHTMMYRTELLKKNFENIKIDEHAFYVDVEYIVFPVPYVTKIKLFQKPIYVYRVNQGAQSTSLQNLVKNKKQHDFVLHRLNEYFQKTSIDLKKREVVKDRISKMIAAQFKIILLQPVNTQTLKELKNFKNEIDDSFEYSITSMNRPIRWLLSSHFWLFPVIHLLAVWKSVFVRK